ncbi:hypothetical protein BLA29_004728 [Euroglyphus maynei]|uniref:Uncharacterized protein n=1 Tax=Euroglyphus maynei TaxID=6958 RepID=A0A1Y3AVE7_EURMA|nr:hypothetical protein BLA29_004728 [Euroglyphus maynei]
MSKCLMEKPLPLVPDGDKMTVTVKRPVTAKVKQGKFRLDLSAPSTSKNDKTKKLKNSQKTDQSNIDQSMMKKSLSNDKSFKITSPTNPANRVILKDSMSFMDALSMMPITNVIKKRRKTTAPKSPTIQTSNSALALNANNNINSDMKRDSFTFNDKSNIEK